MADLPIAHRDIDARGLLCPMPILKLSQGINQVEPGQVVLLQATDPGAAPDVAAWAMSTGNELLHQDRAGNVARFWVLKAPIGPGQ